MPQRRVLRRAWYRVNPENAWLLGWRRRQEVDVVLGRKPNHVVRILLFHIVNGPEQIIEPAGRGHPEQRLRVLL